jgi:CysZ protein
MKMLSLHCKTSPVLKEIIIALRAYKQAHRFIKSNKLFAWIISLGIFYCILFATGMYFFAHTSNNFIEWLNLKTGLKAWLEKQSEDGEWWGFFLTTGSFSLWLVMMLFYFSLFKYFILISGSPIFAYLSEKTVAVIEGRNFSFSFNELKNDIWRGMRIAVRNALWQSVYMLALMFGSIVPVLGLLAVVVTLFVESYYFGFSMLDYSMKKQHKKMSESIFFIGNHKGLAIGNGAVFYIIHCLLVVGWVFAPSYAIIAATLTLFSKPKA